MARRYRRFSRALAVLLALAVVFGAALGEEQPQEAPQELPEFDLTDMTGADPAADEAAAQMPAGDDAAAAVDDAVAAADDAAAAVDDIAAELPMEGAAVAAPELEDAAGAEASADVAAPEADGAGDTAPAEPLRLNASSLTMGVKETFTLQPILPAGVESLAFQFSSDNGKVASVSEGGVITAKKKGSATITVTASTGEQLTCAVTVEKAPKKVILSATSGTLGYDAATGAGTSYKLDVSFPKGSGAVPRFSGYDANVLAVADDGTITARGVGSTTVTVSTFNGRKASCKVRVAAAPEALAFADPAPAMIENEKRRLALTASPQDAYAYAGFASDNPAVAAVDAQTGEVVAVARGEATITATSFNGMTAACRVTVLPGPDKIALPSDTVLVGVGESVLLGATPVRNDGEATGTGLSYASSKTKCAVVDADGVLTGKKKGTAKITVSAANGVKAVCTVKVLKAPTSVSLSAGRRALQFDAGKGIAEQTKLKATVSKGAASSVTYSDYDPAVISVALDGTVTAVGIGTTTVTATTYNGKKGSCRISVCAVGEVSSGGRSVVIVAHRGAAGYWPENTLTAFANAPSTGADAIELDARSTKDGVQVIHHDATFVAGGTKYTIKNLKWAQLHRLKPDVCTLDEALDVIDAGGLRVDLELKDTANARACMQAIVRHGLKDRVMYISFLPRQLEQVRKQDSSAKIGLCFHETPGNLSQTVSALKLKYLFQDYEYLTESNLKAWQAAGIKVGVWTVNDADAIKTWLDRGVDYLTSNYPKRVVEALQQ